MPRGRRERRRRTPPRKKRIKEEDKEGRAGETVVHVQCPWCKKLFKKRDDFCPYCEADITITPQKPDAVNSMEGFEPKHISIYVALILTIFTGQLFIYYLLIPDTGGETSLLGFVLFPFALFLIVLLVLFFIVMKREKITPGIKHKLLIAALLGLFMSCLVIGVGRVGQLFVDEGYQGDWLRDADTIHNLFIISALIFLILLVGYFFYLNYQKKKEK